MCLIFIIKTGEGKPTSWYATSEHGKPGKSQILSLVMLNWTQWEPQKLSSSLYVAAPPFSFKKPQHFPFFYTGVGFLRIRLRSAGPQPLATLAKYLRDKVKAKRPSWDKARIYILLVDEWCLSAFTSPITQHIGFHIFHTDTTLRHTFSLITLTLLTCKSGICIVPCTTGY